MTSLEHKIVVLGSGGVGKSALTIRFVTDNFLEDYDPTIEDSYRKQVIVDDQPALLDILDTAGQEEFVSMQDQWIRDGKGYIIMYDVTNPSTFADVDALKDKILKTKEKKKVPLVLIGNKCDLTDTRKITLDAGVAKAKEWGATHFETSAKEKINVDDGFLELVQLIRKMDPVNGRRQTKKKFKGLKCSLL